MTTNNQKTIFTLRVNTNLKTRFEQLAYELEVSSNGELFRILLDHYEDPSKARERVVEKIVEQPIEVERQLDENEIVVRLNPVQLKALYRLLKHKDFIKTSNKEIKKAMKERSFWNDSLKYPSFFTLYDPDQPQKYNMGLLLVNTFMSAIANGMLREVITANQVRELTAQVKEITVIKDK